MDVDQTNGPDQILPAEGYTTIDIEGTVKLKIPENGKAIETIAPISVPTLIHETVNKFPNHVAYCYKKKGKWTNVTYEQYLQEIRTCAKAFLHLGLEKLHSVCILGFNGPEWITSDLAAIYAGGIAVGIYTTNSSEACFYCAETSRANIIIVEDEKQLEKIEAVRHKLPHLKAIVQYSGEPKSPDVISWKRLMEIGKSQSDDLLEKALKTIAINQCCTMVFTSGTIGNPKAVLLSHDNLTWCAIATLEHLTHTRGKEAIVSYLPLSHVAAQIVDIYIAFLCAGTVYYADRDALKGSLVKTLQEVKPTKFLAVPRVWEKIHEKMMSVASQNGFLKKCIATWAKQQTLNHYTNKINGNPSGGVRYYLAQILFKKVKEALGLQNCTIFLSGAAPLSPEIKKYFLSIDIPIMEAFGMSESAGPHTISRDDLYDLSSIGPTLHGMKTKIVNPDESGQGEMCLYGRHIFMGYINEKEKTDEALDSDGWLHSGDLAKIIDNGLVFITGRLKELLITAGGENVPPVPIEQQVINELPHLSNAVLVGDHRKFLSMLLTLKTEVDSDTAAPLDTLVPETKKWMQELGCPANTVTEVLAHGPDAKLLKAIQIGIDKVNTKATSNAQKIQKFAILPVDFSIATGELGPTMKVKRRIVVDKYLHIIDSFYQ